MPSSLDTDLHTRNMTSHHSADEPAPTSLESIVDYRSLRDRDGVPYHEETEVVDRETVEAVDSLPDLAAVGITNPDGELLFRRLTATCSWKIPVETVGRGEDFAGAIVEHVEGTIGFTVELGGIAGVWDIGVRTDDGERSAARGFVTFRASPVSDSYDLEAATPSGDPVEDADWFGVLPDGADEVPGTKLFFD